MALDSGFLHPFIINREVAAVYGLNPVAIPSAGGAKKRDSVQKIVAIAAKTANTTGKRQDCTECVLYAVVLLYSERFSER